MVSALLCAAMIGQAGVQSAIPVEVVRDDSGAWQLRRDGEQFEVRGVGGTGRMDLLRAYGGNAMRTWGADNLQTELDLAYKYGLTVTAGIWLGHTRHGFDYNNPQDIQNQTEAVRSAVLAHRDHPALLIWSLGNEMEVDGNDTPTLWRHINDLAVMVKELDPHHPVMTVVAEISQQKIDNIKQYAPEIDILGVNSYGGLATLPDRLQEFGWDKPVLVTEFGPLGPWERPRTEWGAAVEQTSTEKAELYRQSILGMEERLGDQFLGSYAFLWGEKQETTPTWFGMFVNNDRTQAVDVMSTIWTGQEPDQRAPIIRSFEFSADQAEVSPGSALIAEADLSDPDGDSLTIFWEIRNEVDAEFFTGEGETEPGIIRGIAEMPQGASIRFEAPSQQGAYRLYMYARDNEGGIAVANSPFFVR